ncbi:hypothetical protein ACVIST_006276 [Bradyrhizobium elkanii]
MNRVPDLGEEDRVRHRRVVEFLGIVILFHAEGAEAAVRRFARRDAGRDRPVIARDAVDRDGHLLVVLVDGDIDLGLCGAGGEEHHGRERNEERTHFTFGLQACSRSRGSPSPATICTESELGSSGGPRP